MSSVETNYDEVLANAEIDLHQFHWLSSVRFTVPINGELREGKVVGIVSESSLREALVATLGEYCAEHAVRAAASVK